MRRRTIEAGKQAELKEDLAMSGARRYYMGIPATVIEGGATVVVRGVAQAVFRPDRIWCQTPEPFELLEVRFGCTIVFETATLETPTRRIGAYPLELALNDPPFQQILHTHTISPGIYVQFTVRNKTKRKATLNLTIGGNVLEAAPGPTSGDGEVLEQLLGRKPRP